MTFLNTLSTIGAISDIIVDINRNWIVDKQNINPHEFLKNFVNKKCVVCLNSVGGGPLGNVLDIILKYKCKYTFVLHNGDNCSSHFFGWNPKFLQIPGKKYFVNLDTNHPDVYGIPLGINLWANGQLRLDNDNLKCVELASDEVDKIYNSGIERKLQIYNDYHTTTAFWPVGDFNIRKNCLKYMQDNSDKFKSNGIDVVIASTRINQLETFKKYRESTFVLSPPGNGYDCHRHYEALILGAIPIIIKTVFLSEKTYKNNGLPVLELEKIEDLTPELLLNFMKTFKVDREKLRVDYWRNLIRSD